ncbi:hypothetical protein CHUAL_009720 [Chamberlinius hualienensis]
MLNESAVIGKTEFFGFDFHYGEVKVLNNLYFFGMRFKKNFMIEMNIDTLQCKEYQLEDRYFAVHRQYIFNAYNSFIVIVSQNIYERNTILYLMDTDSRRMEKIPLLRDKKMYVLCCCIKDDRLYIFLNGHNIRVRTIDLIILKTFHRAKFEDYALLKDIKATFLWCVNHHDDIYVYWCKKYQGTLSLKFYKFNLDNRQFTFFSESLKPHTLDGDFRKIYVIHNNVVLLGELSDGHGGLVHHVMALNLATKLWKYQPFDLPHDTRACNVAVDNRLFLIDMAFEGKRPNLRSYPKLRIFDFWPTLQNICESTIVSSNLDVRKMPESMIKRFTNYYNYEIKEAQQ